MVIKENLLLTFFVLSLFVGLFSISLMNEECCLTIEEIEYKIELEKFIDTSFSEKGIAKNDSFFLKQTIPMFYQVDIYSYPHRDVDTPPPESV